MSAKVWLAALALLMLAVSVASAGVSVESVTTIRGEVAPGETAVYLVKVKSYTTETEHVVLSVENQISGWNYEFNPAEFDIDPREERTTYFNVTPPSSATPGDYYPTINATAYPPSYSWMVEAASYYHNVKTTVKSAPPPTPTPTPTPVPEFTSVALVVAALAAMLLALKKLTS